MAQTLSPVTLTGQRVELRPLSMAHHDDLAAAVSEGELWRITVTSLPTPEKVAGYIDTALQMQAAGSALPFAIVNRATGKAIGSTRYGNIRLEHRCVEIGWTWLSIPWQRTFVNTEAKRLLLGYAFEQLGCIRVELKTDVLNERSRRAIERIGGVQEGILRQHMIMPNGRVRDTVYYSILDSEWPHVKAQLDARISAA